MTSAARSFLLGTRNPGIRGVRPGPAMRATAPPTAHFVSPPPRLRGGIGPG